MVARERDRLEKQVRRLIWLSIGLYALLAVVIVVGFLYLRGASQENATARAGLCALRLDIERRVASSEDFLRQNPHGIPGIPAALIEKGIRDQKRTLVVLNVVKCESSTGG